MTSLDFAALSKDAKAQLALTLASFILHDAKIPVNAENLNKALKASGNDASDSLGKTFAAALEATPVEKFLVCGGGAAGPAPAAAAKDAKPAKEEKKVEAKAKEPEPEPEVDMDMGDLFG